jgi:ABC-type Fe3+-siderophore transport system permease subunit
MKRAGKTRLRVLVLVAAMAAVICWAASAGPASVPAGAALRVLLSKIPGIGRFVQLSEADVAPYGLESIEMIVMQIRLPGSCWACLWGQAFLPLEPPSRGFSETPLLTPT